MQPFLLGIAGGSGSGKSVLVNALADHFGRDGCSVIAQDSYYRGLPPGADPMTINFDHPDAIEFDLLANDLAGLSRGSSVEIPVYDFTTHLRLSVTENVAARPLVLVDGMLLLTHAGCRTALHGSVFLDCAAEVRLARRLSRDTEARGRTPESVHHQFAHFVQPMHAEFVGPSARFADLVIDTEHSDPLPGVLAYLAERLVN